MVLGSGGRGSLVSRLGASDLVKMHDQSRRTMMLARDILLFSSSSGSSSSSSTEYLVVLT